MVAYSIYTVNCCLNLMYKTSDINFKVYVVEIIFLNTKLLTSMQGKKYV